MKEYFDSQVMHTTNIHSLTHSLICMEQKKISHKKQYCNTGLGEDKVTISRRQGEMISNVRKQMWLTHGEPYYPTQYEICSLAIGVTRQGIEQG